MRGYLAGLLNVALRRYLRQKRLEARQYRPPEGPLRITAAEKGGGIADVALEHDRYFAERP